MPGPPMTHPDHEARRQKLCRLMAAPDDPERVVEAFLVTGETNVRYLSGFTGDAAYLVVTPSRSVILSDGRYTQQIAEECPGIEARIRPLGVVMHDFVAKLVRELAPARLGFESQYLTIAEHGAIAESLKDSGIKLVGFAGRVDLIRALKDPFEIEQIRRAVRIAERSLAMFKAGFRPEESEEAAADTLEHFMKRCGAEGPSFPTIMASGERSALPHAQRTSAPVGSTEFLLVDWGAASGGYRSDLTRMVATGKVSAQFERIYRIVLSAQKAAIASIRPGVEARAVDGAARAVIEEAGYGPQFSHSVGHGLGLDIHEVPALRKESTLTLKAGMIVTVEPGIYLPGWGGIRIEDDVLITPEGAEVLSTFPRELESLALD